MKTISIYPDKDLDQLYEKGAKIKSKIEGGATIIQANKAGCIELARHFLYLALDKNFEGYHIHLDETNSLEDGSSELILEIKNAD